MVGGRIDIGMNRQLASPIGAPRTTRMQEVRTLTSLPAGRMVPIFVAGMHREDALRRGTVRFSFEMMETVEVLMNAVNVDVKAYFVSKLAMDRFDGMDALNRAYQGIAVEGLAVVPFRNSATSGGFHANPVMKYMGEHGANGIQYDRDVLEAYNQIWNFRARNRSPDLVPRSLTDTSLAPAFWKHQHFRHIVPSFDQAVIDGEVPLNMTGQGLPVRGITIAGTGITAAAQGYGVTSAMDLPAGTVGTISVGAASPGSNGIMIDVQANAAIAAANRPLIFAEMEANGLTVSLSNIELARKTQAFARLKEQYQGIPDEYVIDLLMKGVRVPDQAFNQPILIGEASTIFGMSKRYATDSGALTDSVVSGATFVDMSFRVPQQNPGGFIMCVAEITPEQLFERQRNPFIHLNNAPDYMVETLDPEKVDVVTNGRIDSAHATPNGTFGYEPLNAKWIIQQPKVGGRYYRSDPASTTNDEDRNRIWAVETVNPSLSADFYICTNIHTKPFVVQNQDPFECVARGALVFDGLTVFGGALVESTGSYDEIMAKVDQTRIVQAEALDINQPIAKAAPKPPAAAQQPAAAKAKENPGGSAPK